MENHLDTIYDPNTMHRFRNSDAAAMRIHAGAKRVNERKNGLRDEPPTQRNLDLDNQRVKRKELKQRRRVIKGRVQKKIERLLRSLLVKCHGPNEFLVLCRGTSNMHVRHGEMQAAPKDESKLDGRGPAKERGRGNNSRGDRVSSQVD